jgi:hypothetical protein
MNDAMGSGGQTFMQAQALDLAATSTLRYKPPSETISVSSIFGEYLAKSLVYENTLDKGAASV